MITKKMNKNDFSQKVFRQLLPNMPEMKNSESGAGTVMMGFACDEGVRRNNGRPGAIGGPEAFSRCWQYRQGDEMRVADGGIHAIQNQALSLFQLAFAGQVSKAINGGSRVMAIGGGHEITWAMHLGMTGADCNEKQPVIGHLNFDAHFDLRPYFNGPNSGTSFCQIADERAFSGFDFHYLCLGLDKKSTPDFLFETARRYGVQYHLNEAVQQWTEQQWIDCIAKFAEPFDRLYVTVDMDVFRADFAPGVSALAKNGLLPEALFPVFQFLSKFEKAQCFDIAELNPLYDEDDKTAKLAVKVGRELIGLE